MSERGAVVGGPGATDGPTSCGSTRRERALSMSRQVLVTIRYIHARKLARGSYVASARHALSRDSWSASSASWNPPSMR